MTSQDRTRLLALTNVALAAIAFGLWQANIFAGITAWLVGVALLMHTGEFQ